MTTDIRPLNSSFLCGSLFADSDQWKKHLEFLYDFVKGIIQENDRYRDEMDRLEKEVSPPRKLHASGGRDIGHRAEILWEDGLPGSHEGKQILSQTTVKRSTEIAMVIIDGDHFKFNSDLLLQGYAGGCFAGRQLLREVQEILPASMKEDGARVLTIVHVYASLEHTLVQSLARESRKPELVSHFIRGFNSINGTMDFVDIGDEGGLMCEKLRDQIGCFSKLPACRFMILGLDDSKKYATCLEQLEHREPYCETSVLELKEREYAGPLDCFLKPIDKVRVFKEAVKKRGLRMLKYREYAQALPSLRPGTAQLAPKKMDSRVSLTEILANRFPRAKENPTATFFELPLEIAKHIFENQKMKTMLKVRVSCRYFNSIFLDSILSAFAKISVTAWMPGSIPVKYVVVHDSNLANLAFRKSSTEPTIRMHRERDDILFVRIVVGVVDCEPVDFLARLQFTKSASYRGIYAKIVTGAAHGRHQMGFKVAPYYLDPVGGYLGKRIGTWDDEYTPRSIIIRTGSLIHLVLKMTGGSTNTVTIEQFGELMTSVAGVDGQS